MPKTQEIAATDNGKQTPRFSILLPVVKTKYFKEAFDSATKQHFEDYEIVVLNNKADADIAWVKENKRVRYYENEERLPLVENINKGIALLSGEYGVILSDDDIFCENFLIETDNFFRKHDVDIVRVPRKEINEFGETVGFACPAFSIESFAEHIYYEWRYSRAPCLSDFAFRRKAILDAGGLDRRLGWNMDYLLVAKIAAQRNRIGSLNSVQMHYRLSSINSTNTMGAKRSLIRLSGDFILYEEIRGLLEKTNDEFTPLAIEENEKRILRLRHSYYEYEYSTGGWSGVLYLHRNLPAGARRKDLVTFLLKRSLGTCLNAVLAFPRRILRLFKFH
ncbi:MAG: glycosyltransferase family 2 protein [Puniceicoccales bacterium]|nr:glycosyltransferase family 2 protein [Puniceicoccales bacterium]